jgi:hypothetical protein
MKLNSVSQNHIPANERWLHEPRAAAEFQSALIWATETKPSENTLSNINDGNELASLLLKVEAGRTSMRAGLGRSNDEVEASLVERRAAVLSQI